MISAKQQGSAPNASHLLPAELIDRCIGSKVWVIMNSESPETEQKTWIHATLLQIINAMHVRTSNLWPSPASPAWYSGKHDRPFNLVGDKELTGT